MLQRELRGVFVGRRRPVANFERRADRLPTLTACRHGAAESPMQLDRRIDGRMGVAAARPGLDRRRPQLPWRVRIPVTAPGSASGQAPANRPSPFQDRRRPGEAERRQLRRYHSSLRGAAGMEMLAHGAGLDELPEAARLGSRVAQGMHGLAVVEPSNSAAAMAAPNGPQVAVECQMR